MMDIESVVLPEVTVVDAVFTVPAVMFTTPLVAVHAKSPLNGGVTPHTSRMDVV